MLHELIIYLVPCWLINIACGAIYPFKQHSSFIRRIDAPIDSGRLSADGKRLLGDSTTRLGLPVALLAGLIIGYALGGPLAGMVKGLTVFAGHALGSFIKRRFGYTRGAFMPIVDHGDFVITTGVVFGLLHWERWPVILLAMFITLIVTPPWNYLTYRLGLHRDPL